MADPPYPDIGSASFCANDEETKRSLLNEAWTSCFSYPFPFRTFGNKQRKLNGKWLLEKKWLRYSKSKDAVYCVNCCLFGGNDGREKTFTSGTSDWKNLSSLLKRHEVETCHIHASSKAESYQDIQSGKCESINKKLSDSSRTTVNNNRHILQRIIEVIVLCAKQNIPFRGHTAENSNFNVILTAFAKNDEILSQHLASAHYNAKYTSPDVQNEVIGICAEHVREKITSDCRKCPFFAIIVDEATDKSTKEQLSLCVRYVDDDSCVKEEFLGFVECPSVKGADICANILSFLQEVDLDILKIRAQCYDGASNMSGKYRGVQALVRERSPHANYVHCKAHCLNLALVHSSQIPCVRTMMSTVQDVSFMFDYSAKRLL